MTTVTAKPKLVEEQRDQRDFLDEIAELLPAEQRPPVVSRHGSFAPIA